MIYSDDHAYKKILIDNNQSNDEIEYTEHRMHYT